MTTRSGNLHEVMHRAAWDVATTVPEGDIRALRHRIHELEGDLKEARHANEKHIARIVGLQDEIRNLTGEE